MPSRALVTGAGRGIGASIARELAGNGWHVTVSGRTAAQVEAVAGEIGGTAVTGDVSKREDVERMVAAAAPLDLLVANAGINLRGDSWETDTDEWWHLFEVNVLGTYLTCRQALPGMIERGGGRIVIVGSGASYLPGLTSGAAYAASKAAVGRFGEVLAREVEAHGIKVFVISPGLVRTEMTEGWAPDDAPWTPPSSRRGSCSSSPPAASTRSPGATSTPSTTRRTSSRRGSPGSCRRPERDPAPAREPQVTDCYPGSFRGTIQVWRASASSSPSSDRRAVPAWSLRPSSPRGQPMTMHRSPSSGRRSIRAAIRPSSVSPRPCALRA